MRIFDAHFHIIDPRYNLDPRQGYMPEPFAVDEYRKATKGLGVVGGAVVAGSFHGFKQEHLLSDLQLLGPAFVGVALLPFTTSDADIVRLNSAGVRAMRINLRRGLKCSCLELAGMADRVYHLAGWHTEIYADGAQLAKMFDCLSSLPKVVIDHLGLTREAAPILIKLIEAGALAKVSGFGRLDFHPIPFVRTLARANPAGLLFGTDIPSTRARRSFRKSDIKHLMAALEPEDVPKVLYKNATTLYRPIGLRQ